MVMQSGWQFAVWCRARLQAPPHVAAGARTGDRNP